MAMDRENETGNLKHRIWSSKQDALNDREAEMMLAACNDFLDNVVVRAPLFAGMRIGEVQHMRDTWLDWKQKIIGLPARQLCTCYECRKWRRGVWTPKTEQGIRSLILVPELSFLKELSGGIHRSRQALEQRFERIRARSGIMKVCYPHALRATFATRLADRGISAPALTYLMGWSGLEPAESYIQSSMKKAHQEFRDINR